MRCCCLIGVIFCNWQLRDENHQPLPGIELGEVGPKLGDNCTETGIVTSLFFLGGHCIDISFVVLPATLPIVSSVFFCLFVVIFSFQLEQDIFD